MKHTVTERFLRYVTIDTQADPESNTSPSTEKQKILSNLLLKELREIGVKAETDEYGYVYGYIPSNVDHPTDSIFFCSHVDTAPDCSGKDVKPILHKSYQGQDIILPDDPEQVITIKAYPYLRDKVGEDIITASGLTLLGADDKSGVAVIMDLAYQLVNNPEIKHGDITILFTTDEEIGKGVAHVNYDKIKCNYGFTLDGGPRGEYCEETFSADAAIIEIKGVAAHPGYAKGKMESAIKIAAKIIDTLPKEYLAPEATDSSGGFIHPGKLVAELEEARIEFILREFDTSRLSHLADHLRNISDKVIQEFPHSSYTLTIKEQYRNMKDIVSAMPHIKKIAYMAMEKAEIKPHQAMIRGGTDGSVLSANGLPCPNLFTGMQAIHSKHEYISVQDMQKAVETILNICQIVAEPSLIES
jgi:tripeptide aminopeptidase